jgi:hypothetical protein
MDNHAEAKEGIPITIDTPFEQAAGHSPTERPFFVREHLANNILRLVEDWCFGQVSLLLVPGGHGKHVVRHGRGGFRLGFTVPFTLPGSQR